ncbi:MAG: L,D-transpeptidase family protein [Chromatiales bacterium]|nr:L,D-transpeptidase family protein [Chromatiales bacterium]
MKNVKTQFRTGRALLIIAATLASPVALSATYVLPPADVDLIGAITTVEATHEETLLDIARAHGVGFEDIVSANPDLDPWIPGEGATVVLPTRFILPRAPREGVVLNLPELRMYYYPKPVNGEAPVVVTYPISIGRMDWQTPLGQTRVTKKVRNPSWYPPESIRREHAEDGDPLPKIVPAGPDNPLGAFAMRLGIPGYLIHSTNKPAGVGMRVTHGCIRMYPENIEALFEMVPVGEKVLIINQPYKVGWSLDGLYLEAHQPLEEDAETLGKDLTSVTEMLVAATARRNGPVDWDLVREIFDRADGLPGRMSDSSPGLQDAGEIAVNAL